ncbi:hypothetical protein AHMF7605_24410 [Adhaeribacter arboris]|uniref:Uncharacterized protein n=1 Tax=Adhaeribacter arboris TaxID=2072846 RepID=A0A2T2YLP8_9BACT|nr:hypothetical protein [Adhaeribacter arboris]PSR56417.1 hypothetical protein AHMF7605_24410 [Adhaeribacter arboris]
MNIKDLNSSLITIIQKKQELSKLTYDDDRYDEIEEELHDLEDDFNENFGDFLEDILTQVHDKVCPDTDVLLPTAYLPTQLASEDNATISAKEGVWVDTEEFPDREARLVLVPNPTRLVLSVGKNVRKEVWKA